MAISERDPPQLPVGQSPIRRDEKVPVMLTDCGPPDVAAPAGGVTWLLISASIVVAV